jgi:hypothetical protein
MVRRIGIAVSLLTALLAVAPAARADDPVKDIIDHEVPALKDGTRIALSDVQAAILAACKRRRFEATVVSPGVITARWVHGSHSFDVTIPFTDSAYSIRHKDSQRMDYNAARQRIDDSYNEFVAALSEHIEADFERALKRLKVERMRMGSLPNS